MLSWLLQLRLIRSPGIAHRSPQLQCTSWPPAGALFSTPDLPLPSPQNNCKLAPPLLWPAELNSLPNWHVQHCQCRNTTAQRREATGTSLAVGFAPAGSWLKLRSLRAHCSTCSKPVLVFTVWLLLLLTLAARVRAITANAVKSNSNHSEECSKVDF